MAKSVSIYKSKTILQLEQSKPDDVGLGKLISRIIDRYTHLLINEHLPFSQYELDLITKSLVDKAIDRWTAENLHMVLEGCGDEIIIKVKNMNLLQRYALLNKVGL